MAMFLIVDAHLMASAAWQNLGERTLRETAELDRAVKLDENMRAETAAIIVCGDAAIGGMSVNGYPFRYDSGVAILGLNSAGQPWVTWATGPMVGKAAETSSRQCLAISPPLSQRPFKLHPHSIRWKTRLPMPLALGMEKLRGTIDNTHVFEIIRDAL